MKQKNRNMSLDLLIVLLIGLVILIVSLIGIINSQDKANNESLLQEARTSQMANIDCRIDNSCYARKINGIYR